MTSRTTSPKTTNSQGPTTDYGSVLDGSHIDQKTARRVSDEERLFFVILDRQPGTKHHPRRRWNLHPGLQGHRFPNESLWQQRKRKQVKQKACRNSGALLAFTP